MTEFIYPTVDDLLAAAELLTGQRLVRDYGLLHAAVQRPQTTAFDTDAYPDLATKAAALLHSIVRNHPLIDGNKRLGWAGVRLMYGLNDRHVSPPNVDAAHRWVLGVADGSLGDDVHKIADTLREWEERTDR